MKYIKEIKDLKGKRVIVRVDFNVPIKDGKVIDDFRIKKSIPTISYLVSKGAKVVVISHLGSKDSLYPVFVKFKKQIPSALFSPDKILSDKTEKIVNNLKNGEVLLLENLRQENGEEENSPSFARAMSRYGDIYINDAFSVSHRKHASVVGIPSHLPSYAGFQLEQEINNLSKAFNSAHPFLFILGGAKFETKMPLIKKFIRSADDVFIGGALANDFFKFRGYETGVSLVGNSMENIKSLSKYKNLVLPSDVEVNKGKVNRFVKPNDVNPDENIVDVGPETIKKLEEIINKSKFILWNGPLGKYENGFGGSTEKLLKIISKSKAQSIIGGGDTVAIISKLKIEDKFSFVSTGGGATLDFLANGTLIGIKALK